MQPTGEIVLLPEQQKQAEFVAALQDIDNMLLQGHADAWESITDLAGTQESEADRRRWNNVYLAARVGKQYGEDMIGQFALAANIPKRRAQEYHTMGLFYDFINQMSAHEEFLVAEENAAITYSHFRTAQRFDSREMAYRALEKAAKRAWSSDKLAYIAGRWRRLKGLSQKANTVEPIIDEVMTVKAAIARLQQMEAEMVIDLKVSEVTG